MKRANLLKGTADWKATISQKWNRKTTTRLRIALVFSIVLLASSILASCGKTEDVPLKNRATTTVRSGSLVLSDRIGSVVRGKDSAELAFKSSGRISEMNANVWQTVKKGQILAKLSAEESGIMLAGNESILLGLSWNTDFPSVLQSLNNVRNSTASLYDSRLSGAKSDIDNANIRLQIAQSESDLAKTDFQNAQVVLSGSILSSKEREDQAEKSLEIAKNQLSNAISLLQAEEDGLYRASLSSLSNAFILARNAREYTDVFLGVSPENQQKNDTFERYLDTYATNRTNTLYLDFDRQYRSTYDWYVANIFGKSNVGTGTVQEALQHAAPALDSLREVLHGIKDILTKTTASADFPQSTIDAYNRKTDEYLSNLEQIILSPAGWGVRGNMQALDSFWQSKNSKISDLQGAVTIAENNLLLAKTGKSVSESSVKKDLDSLQAQLGIKQKNVDLAKKSVLLSQDALLTLNGERQAKIAEIDGSIAELRIKIAESKMQTSLAVNAMENQILRAPFDGVVLSKNFDTGCVVQSGTPILEVTSEEGTKVLASLDSARYALSKWSSLALQRENGESFTGTVVSVSSAKDPITSKNPMEITVSDKALHPGERVWAIPAVSGKSGPLIPISSITTKYSLPSVFVVENGYARLTPVRLLEKDDSFALIEGIPVGAEIVTEGKDDLLDSEKIR